MMKKFDAHSASPYNEMTLTCRNILFLFAEHRGREHPCCFVSSRVLIPILACLCCLLLAGCTSQRSARVSQIANPPSPEVHPLSLPSSCDTPDPNVDFYKVVQTNTPVPPHAVFCGNYAKSPIPAEVLAGKSPPMTPPGDSPTGLPYQKRCGPGEGAPAGSYVQGCCVSHAYDSDCSVAPNTCRVPATEKVEIRGTVVGIERYTDTSHGAHNQEYNFDVLLDLNWDKDPCLPDGITTINSLDALANAVTPFNIATFGGETEFGPDGKPRDYTGTSPYRYGGPGSLIIKVEIDGWERGNRIPTSGSPSRDYGPAPPGWVPGTGQSSDSHVLWPFNPDRPLGNTGEGPLRSRDSDYLGDYVRVVGTLWEDQEHGSSGVVSCWQDGPTVGRAHMEIHPVDYLARVVPAKRTRLSTYTALALCDNATIDKMEIIPPDERPADAPANVDVEIVPAFTTPGTPSQPEKPGDKVLVSAAALNWHDSSGSHKGKFFAVYRVYWDSPCPAGKTSCQNSCVDPQSFQNDSNNCSKCGLVCQGGTSCSAGMCVCPAGKTMCNGVCVDTATDSNNCSACGVFCDPMVVGGIGVCQDSKCVCPQSAPSVCSYGDERVCTNLDTQNDNCGTCGHHCLNGTCSSAACVCAAGLQACPANDGRDTICTTVATDGANCGKCGRVCPSGSSCQGNECVSGGCPAGWTMCGGTCTNTDFDNLNCGGCNRACRPGRTCDGGACVRNPRN